MIYNVRDSLSEYEFEQEKHKILKILKDNSYLFLDSDYLFIWKHDGTITIGITSEKLNHKIIKDFRKIGYKLGFSEHYTGDRYDSNFTRTC